MKGRNSILALIIIIVLGVVAYEYRNSPLLAALFGAGNAATSQQQVNKVSYACDAGKTITATYYQGSTTGTVALTLSDGRSLTLPQTVSGSGIRYANADESVVFWSKGNTAFMTEGSDQKQTFANCIEVSNISGQEGWHTYASSAQGFSIRYPDGWTLDSHYTYQNLGSGKDINGVKITIPESMATGTNLSSDSYISVEEIPNATICAASLFMGDQIGSTTEETDNDVTYSTATGADAAAGNRYSETVYAISGTNPCIGIRYFVHSSEIDNYPAGTVKVFDQNALTQTFDGIRASLVIGK